MGKEKSPFTIRSFIVGSLLSALVVVMAQYSVNVVHGSYLCIDHMPAGGITVFFLFVFFVVPLLKRIHPRLDFSRAELVLIYSMILVTCSIATMGLGTQFLSMVAGVFYYATPENHWGELILPHIKSWLAPTDPTTIKYFFEGLPKGVGVPWSAWFRPLVVWISFFMVLYFVMICSMVLLRKQWIHRERLVYPLAQLPREMIARTRPDQYVSPFFKSKLMWIGFAIPFIISSINALHMYFFFFPQIQLVGRAQLAGGLLPIQFRLSFPIVGFAYFINLRVAFGLWFFNIFSAVLRAFFMKVGIASQENMGTYGAWSPIFKHLGMGAITALVLYGLYAARAHLKDVLRTALFKRPDVDASEEILPWRVAFWGWVLGVIALSGWLAVSGLNFFLALIFILMSLMIFIGITRVVAQGGMPTLIAPSIAPSQLISSIGCAPIKPEGLTVLGYTYIWDADIRTFVMSAAAHALRLTDDEPGPKRRVFWAMMLACLIGLVVSSAVVLHLAYHNGGVNLNSWYFSGNIHAAFRYISEKIEQPTGPDKLGWFCKFIGAGVMTGLLFLQRRFLWWPLHPLGFAVGANGWMNMLWFSVFLAWLFKAVILRYGGPKLFKAGQPFFLGLVLGQYSCAGLWFLMDWYTGMTGNIVFWI